MSAERLRPTIRKSPCRGVATTASCLLLLGALALSACQGGNADFVPPPPTPDEEGAEPLAGDEVRAIMERAATATAAAIAVAVTDRRGVILGVATNFGLTQADYVDDCADAAAKPCPAEDTPAASDCAVVDRAVQLARTAAFFSADQTPLTSRAVRFLSGPHFPPNIRNTGAAALFGIENTNRGCSFDAAYPEGADFLPGQAVPQALNLAARFRPGLLCENGDDLDSRCGCTDGINTLPGAVPIYKNGRMGGGVGVALRGVIPAPDPVAAFDGPHIVLRRDDDDPAYTVAEFAARAFAGDGVAFPGVAPKGLPGLCGGPHPPACCAATPACFISILPAPPPLPFDPVIFVDGVAIPEIDLNPPIAGVNSGAPLSEPLVLDPEAPDAATAEPVPSQWLVGPNPSTPGAAPLSAGDVEAIIDNAITQAQITRAAIRLPLATATAMVLAVSDTNGALIGLFRMSDATVFSIDVAVAKSRNVLYFSSQDIAPADARDMPGPGVDFGQAYPIGTAITNRTLAFGSQPFFPSGIEGSLPGFDPPFAPGPFRSVFLEDSALRCTNGRQPTNGRQNGIVFFPGSAPLYRADGTMVAGLGISGDGVEQDDLVTFAGSLAQPGYTAPGLITRADEVFVRGVRLPYLKFNRRPDQF